MDGTKFIAIYHMQNQKLKKKIKMREHAASYSIFQDIIRILMERDKNVIN